MSDAWYFEDVLPGATDESAEVVADRAEMIAYAVRNDPWPIHLDASVAAKSGFADVTASFGYTLSVLFRLVHTLEINKRTAAAFLGALEWVRVQFRRAVQPGDRLRLRVTVTSTRLTSRGDRGVSKSRCVLLNHHDEDVVAIDVVSMFLTRAGAVALGI